MLEAKVKLDWTVIATYKHSSLFGLVISDEGKKFYNIDTQIKKILSIKYVALCCSARLDYQQTDLGI